MVGEARGRWEEREVSSGTNRSAGEISPRGLATRMGGKLLPKNLFTSWVPGTGSGSNLRQVFFIYFSYLIWILFSIIR